MAFGSMNGVHSQPLRLLDLKRICNERRVQMFAKTPTVTGKFIRNFGKVFDSTRTQVTND